MSDQRRSAETNDALEATWPWRTGTSVGRTIYACPPGSSHRQGEVLIGLMDSPELAQRAVDAHNCWLAIAEHQKHLARSPGCTGTSMETR